MTKSFLAGLGGAVLVLVLWQGYQDHVALQRVVAFLNASVAEQQKQAAVVPEEAK